MAYADLVTGDGATTYYRLGESSGTTADDAVGSDDHTYQSSPTLGATGLISDADTAVTLNGSSQYISQASPSANLNLGDKFTVELWLKRGRSGQQEDLWGRNWGGGQIVRFTSDNKITLRKSGVANIVQATATITDTATHHVVVTKNGSTVKIYIDGSDVTGTVTNQTFGSVSGASVIGRDAAGSSGYFQGTLDEVAFYKNVELTSTQVASHYALGTGGATVVSRSAAVSATTAVATDRRVITTARRQSFGICVHPGWTDKTYNDYANCFSDLDALNIRLLRGGATGDGNITQWLSRCYQRGTGMIYGPPDKISDLTSGWLDTLEAQIESYPGVIVAIEGLNEPDLFGPYAEQDVGGGETNCEYALRHQTALYNAITGRFGSALPVLAPSISSDWSDALANDVDGYCDLANVHYYTAGGTASPDLAAINTQMSNARSYAGVTDTWVTETGIRSPVTGCTEAEGAGRLVQILNRFTIDAATPALKVCVYQLESPDSTGWEENDWAIHYYGFSPKLDATAYGAYIDGRTGYFKATSAITASGAKVTATVIERSAALGATTAIAVAGIESLARSAALAATADVSASGFERELERVAALTASTSIATVALEQLARSASIAATTGISVAGARLATVSRTAALDAATAIAAVPTRIVTRTASLGATTQIVSTGREQLARSAAVTAVTQIATVGREQVARTASVTAITAVATVGQVIAEVVTGSAAITATAAITTSGHIVKSRTAALTASTGVTATGSLTRLRAAALTATSQIATVGTETGVTSRSAALTGTTQIVTGAGLIRLRAATLAATAQIATVGTPLAPSVTSRAATLTAATLIATDSGLVRLRSASLAGLTELASTATATRYRSASLSGTSAIASAWSPLARPAELVVSLSGDALVALDTSSLTTTLDTEATEVELQTV